MRLRYAKVAQAMAQTANIGRIVFCTNCHKSVIRFSRLWQFAQWLCGLGISQASTFAESKQIPLDLETRFLHRWMRYCLDLCLEMADF
jgi:hypothetical protein